LSLRIAMVIDPWLQPFNGTVVSTRRFVSALEAAGCHLNLLAIGGDQSERPGPNRVLTRFTRLSVPGFNRLIDAMRAPLARPDRALIRQALLDSDLLHVQFPFLLGHAALGEAKRLGLPVVCTFHVQPENILINIGLESRLLRDFLYWVFVTALYNRATLVVAPTEFAANLLREHGVKRPIAVISNGVPEAFFNVSREPAQTLARPMRVLSVGRLAKEKHNETLLHAVAASAYRNDIELTLAGAGPREDELKALAISLGVDARIGPVSDEALLALYARADLFVHCGAVELEGMSVLEAMAAGLTVIVSDSPESASAQIATDARMLFRSGDWGDLAAKMDHWLGDPARRAAQGQTNRRDASAFSHQRSVSRLLGQYDDVMTRSMLRASDALETQ
jgi:1,2-diacylglycerol 3-alpha-glucosyltransferase